MEIATEPTLTELGLVLDLADLLVVTEDANIALGEPIPELSKETLFKAREWLSALEGLDSLGKVRLATSAISLIQSDYELSTTLTLSTGHISEDTAKRLEKDEKVGLPFHAKGDNGWVIYVGLLPDDPQMLPEDLEVLVVLSRELGVDWLCLDSAGPFRENLQTYDW